MRITIEIDDLLMGDARSLTGISDDSLLLTQAVETLIRHLAAERLARLGGTEPDLEAPPRRRPDPEGPVDRSGSA